jgi:hypothetical protein
MVVVVLIAGGAAVCLRLYRAAMQAPDGAGERVLFSIRQQAGVMAALAATVFAVLTALTTGKATALPPGGVPTAWGSRPQGALGTS